MTSGKARPKVVARGDVATGPVSGAKRTAMATLIGAADGAASMSLRRFVIEPGGIIPAHTHPDIEHEQIVISGEMILYLAGDEHRASAGDAVFIPAGSVHRYENRTDRPVEFICVIPATAGYRTEWHEDNGRA